MTYDINASNQERWEATLEELLKRLYFQPSSMYYFYRMAVNHYYSKLKKEAEKLNKAVVYAKYFIMDIAAPDVLESGALDSTASSDLYSSVIQTSLDSISHNNKVRLTRQEALVKYREVVSEFNINARKIATALTKANFLVYTQGQKDFILERFVGKAGSLNDKGRISKALVGKSSVLRESTKRKAEGASFSINDTTVSTFLDGYPIEPSLLGIEVGDLVNDSVTVTKVSAVSFETASTVAQVDTIESPLHSDEESATILVGYSIVWTKIPDIEANPSVPQMVRHLEKEVVPEIQRIDRDLLNLKLLGRMGITVEATPVSLSTTLASLTPVGYTKKQRKDALSLLKLLESRGYDVASIRLTRLRPMDVLVTNAPQSSKEVLADLANNTVGKFGDGGKSARKRK